VKSHDLRIANLPLRPGSSGVDRQIKPLHGKMTGRNIMSNEINHERRRFFGAAAMTIAAAQFGLNNSAEAQPERQKTLDARAFKPGTNTSFASLKQIDAGLHQIRSQAIRMGFQAQQPWRKGRLQAAFLP
jgi:hypothetical protein